MDGGGGMRTSRNPTRPNANQHRRTIQTDTGPVTMCDVRRDDVVPASIAATCRERRPGLEIHSSVAGVCRRMMLRRSLQGFVGGVVRRGLPGNRAAFSSSGAAFYYEMPSVSVDERGDSVFGTLRIPLDKDGGEIGQLSRLVSGTGTFLRRTPGTYNFSWHQAPRRQFIVNLDAAVEVTVTNGDKRVMDKGDVFFVEDISGTGHFSKAVGGKTRHSMFITVDDTALRVRRATHPPLPREITHSESPPACLHTEPWSFLRST